MQQSSNVLDKWANRVLFLQRLGWGLLFAVVVCVVGIFSYYFWLAVRADVFDLPSYEDINSESDTYWSDRMERDVAYVDGMKVSEIRKASRLRLLVNRQLSNALALESYYERNHAILAIALTLTKHNLDVNIDKTLRTMNETYESYSIRARIYISIALMQVRQKNLIGAISAYSEYKRLLNYADLKLDTAENEESFIGAVTVLYLVQNFEELADLFRIQIEFSRRINSSQRMRAYRLIAVEQARSGNFLPNAINTFKMIHDTVEISRAMQLVIAFVARPPKIEPVEPAHVVPRSDGPWETIRSTLVVRNTIESILRIIIKEASDLEQLQSILKRIAGSILMCDPDVYKIFRSAIQDMPNLDKTIKNSVLKLLDNPVSDKIRAELKMPPCQKNNGEGISAIDPARHDWIDDKEAIDIQITMLDTETLKSIDIRQYTRILSVAATSYLHANRTADATATLRKAFNSTIHQPDQTEQIRSLTTIAGLQFDTVAIEDAHKTLQILNRKLIASNQSVKNNPDNTADLISDGIVDGQILNLVELQITGRYFDEARKTIQHIKSIPLRDSALMLFARELIRTDQLDDAAKIIEIISDTAFQNEYKHRLTIAQTESKVPINSAISIVLSEESLTVVGINNPFTTTGNENISRSVSQLIRFGFFESAVIAVKRIADVTLQSKLLTQIGHEYVLIFSSYSHPNNLNQVVSERAINNAVTISTIISDAEQRIIFTLSIINAILNNKRYDKDSVLLQHLFELVLADVESVSKNTEALGKSTEENKENAGNGDKLITEQDSLRQLRGEIFSSVLLAKINLERLRIEEVNNRNKNTNDILNNNVAILTEKVIKELDKEKLSVSKVRGLVNISLAFLRGGQLQETANAAKTAENAATELTDRSHVISALIDLMAIYKLLNDMESFKRVRDRAVALAVSFIPLGIDVRHINVAWRTRDIELDRIMRKLIELDKIDDVLATVENIHEPIIYDRVMRTIVYINLDKNNFNAAESVAKKLRLPEYRFAAIRDTNFIKNLTTNDNSENIENK
ncbi:MAG: hypothetical protein LBC74_01235 [Planctomycetaceae bacterium]|jgi:hypothetical protein|nr:hypothetical protein [Planctomycetaceae bacterium]